MLAVRAVGVSKRFGTTLALDQVDLTVEPGELFTLLGPSGCGKTTLLRLLAGLEEAGSGQIYFGESRVDQLPAYRRSVGMVFQSYALFPHLSVEENVKYGLKARGVEAAEIERLAKEGLAMVGLSDLTHRAPGQLSGGQQQRVALARALVTRPSLLLMDEPLSNLDARLRIAMRAEVRRIVKEAGITTVYVTHDQEEALAISDRIGVMEAGRLIQVGSPVQIYRAPASRQVAAFVGACSFLPGEIRGGLLALAGSSVRVALRHEGPVTVGIRPEAPVLSAAGAGEGLVLTGQVAGESFLGPFTQVEVRLPGGGAVAVASTQPPGSLAPGAPVTLRVAAADLLLFDAATGGAIR
ncbi:MAG: ABC transporter ATP-binding protein [Bacillota bacterium]